MVARMAIAEGMVRGAVKTRPALAPAMSMARLSGGYNMLGIGALLCIGGSFPTNIKLVEFRAEPSNCQSICVSDRRHENRPLMMTLRAYAMGKARERDDRK